MPEAPIAVAMSGGVDSSTVAALLRRDGHDIVGMTMQLWNQRRLPEISPEGATGRCCSLEDVYDARHVAGSLGIPYYVVNFEDRFEESVIRPFIDEYLAGRTPIPCTLCNNFVKFHQFHDLAAGVGAHMVATGHYARIRRDDRVGRHLLLRAVDAGKDQTYFLWGLTQEQLSRTMFPLGEFTKPEVRELARSLGVAVAEKQDSQEICFVPNGDYAQFIDAYFGEKGMPREDVRGEIVDAEGRKLGEHGGVHHFTVGQRKGLGIAAKEPLYVIATQPAAQRVIVGRNADLLRTELTASQANWISVDRLLLPMRVTVKIRNKHEAAHATVHPLEDAARFRVHFDEPLAEHEVGQVVLVVGAGRAHRSAEAAGVLVATVQGVHVLHLGLHVLELDPHLQGMAPEAAGVVQLRVPKRRVLPLRVGGLAAEVGVARDELGGQPPGDARIGGQAGDPVGLEGRVLGLLVALLVHVVHCLAAEEHAGV
ncbi:MAG: tRNA 2-thiouridine(34) synthase MnmA, partial [Candidatus Solibacter usitatus]|nr:tRNA 2-thiouridine(34) synthase MnmA [Candidatus Solibacter usitatus]